MDQLITQPDDQENAMIEQVGKRLLLSNQFAETMCRASLLPVHLRTTKRDGEFVALEPAEIQANCVLIVNQALRWGVDPFAILPSTFVVKGRLGFDGKLIAAIVNKLANLEEALKYTFAGTGDALTVTVTGTIRGETEPRTVTVSVGEAKTDNDIWTTDPEQKLCYTGATRWARRHAPQVILGIVSNVEPLTDEAETMDAVNVRRTPRNQSTETTSEPYQVVRSVHLAESYEDRITAAQTQDQLTDLVDKIRSEPLELLPEQVQEALVIVARGRYTELAEEATV